MLGSSTFALLAFVITSLALVGCGEKTEFRNLMNSQVLQAGDGSTTNLDGSGNSTADQGNSDQLGSNSNGTVSNPNNDDGSNKPSPSTSPKPNGDNPDRPNPTSSPMVPNPTQSPLPPSAVIHSMDLSRVCRVRTDIRPYYLGGGTGGLSPTAPKEIRFYNMSATLTRQTLLSSMDLPLQIPQGYRVQIPDAIFAGLSSAERSQILVNVCEKTAPASIGVPKSTSIAGCLKSGDYTEVFSFSASPTTAVNRTLRISYSVITSAQLATPSTRPAYCDEAMSSPLVLDLDGNGIGLKGPSLGTSFDLFGIGTAVHSGWVKSAKDSFLSLDLNQNGKIDSGLELFGDTSKMANGKLADNGFEALRQYDSNRDNIIDSRDDVFDHLLLWDDVNHNQFSEAGEISTARSQGIRSIDLGYQQITETDSFGNQTLQRSIFKGSQGAGLIVDIWFIVRLK